MACSDSDYAYLREIVFAQSANLIDPSRNALFDMRLKPVAQIAGAASLEDFVCLLRNDRPAHLHRAVAEAMTINETSFYRDVKPFEALRMTVLPRLIEARAAEKKLRIWSAACSTGQEAYSVAMLIHEHFPELSGWNVKIVGTDISQQVVDYAQAGRYKRLEVNRGLPAKMLLRYFARKDESWEISSRIKALCEFRQANLCTPAPSLRRFDLVLLRNVLLYFPQHERSWVLREVHRQINPGGYLFLGNAEQAEDSSDLFDVEFAEGSYFYQPAAR